MAEEDLDRLEQALVRAGKMMAYPATPSLAPRVSAELQAERHPRARFASRPVYVAALAILLAFALLIAFPEAREALAQILGLRTVRIISVTPTATLAATPTPGIRSTPVPTRTPAAFVQCCETTLADAQARTQFKLLVPSTEAPSQVYFQELKNLSDSQQVILLFGDPSAPQFTLYEATGFLYGKIVSGGTVIEETQVRGQRALWLAGAPHLLVYLDANGQPQFQSERTVNANTLAWEIGNVTYRVETNATKDAAIRFAESLQ